MQNGNASRLRQPCLAPCPCWLSSKSQERAAQVGCSELVATQTKLKIMEPTLSAACHPWSSPTVARAYISVRTSYFIQTSSVVRAAAQSNHDTMTRWLPVRIESERDGGAIRSSSYNTKHLRLQLQAPLSHAPISSSPVLGRSADLSDEKLISGASGGLIIGTMMRQNPAVSGKVCQRAAARKSASPPLSAGSNFNFEDALVLAQALALLPVLPQKGNRINGNLQPVQFWTSRGYSS